MPATQQAPFRRRTNESCVRGGMAASSTTFHESAEQLKPATRDRHRAIASLMEELEAVDWYDQRIDAAHDEELRAILAHNRDEEKEHAAMVLEWLRRRDPQLDAHLKGYLFTDKNLLEREEALEHAEDAGKREDGSLRIGSLRGAAR
jgi:ferritin-like protein